MSRTLHRRSRRLAIIPASAVVLALGATAPAPLPAQETGIIEEIIVTAQRREEQIQDIPLAVTAFNSSQLETLQVDQALDMGRLVPNLVAHNNTGLGTANAYSLRGLNNTESISTFDPPVGSYIDDIYVARQNANNFTLFDVDRIEVLRGPQGTLFGRNTTGGAVRVILKKPAEEMGGYLELGAGEYDRYVARGSIDMPVSENFLTKFSAFWIEDDGFVENRTTGDTLNDEENVGVRGAFLWRISDTLEWDLAVDYEDTSDANVTYNFVGDERVSLTGLAENGTPLAPFFTGKKRNFNFGNDVEAFNVTSNLDWDVGGGTLSFIAGYRDLNQEFALDFLDGNARNRASFGQEPPAYGGFSITNDSEHEQTTLELKYTGDLTDNISYVAGVFYLDEENTVDFGDIFDFDLGLAAFPFQPTGNYIPLVLADRILENNTESWAAYLQTDIRFLEAWTLTLGVRYTDESKDVSFKDNQPCAPGDVTCFVDNNTDGISDNDLNNVNLALFGIGRDLDTDLWTPRVALQYEFNPEVNVYASATRGFKSGGWNARGTTPDQLQPFDAEVVWSYELGLRSSWLDNRLRANVTAFYLDVSDFQLPTAFQPVSGQVQFITRNFAGLENKGIELELIAQPIEPLTLLATIGFQDAEYQDLAPEIVQQQQDCRDALANNDPTLNICNAGIVDPDGNIADPTRTPDYTATLGAIYTHDLGNGFELTPSAYLYRVGDHNVFSSGSPNFVVDGYSTWNGSVELRDTDDNWGVVVECKNCNDRKMLVSGLAGQPYYQDPRTWMVRFRKDFGN